MKHLKTSQTGMIKGFKKLRLVEPGSLIRFRDGEYALVSEYHTGDKGHYDTYLYGTGKMCHVDSDEWVAIVDIQAIEVEIFEEAEYPAEGS